MNPDLMRQRQLERLAAKRAQPQPAAAPTEAPLVSEGTKETIAIAGALAGKAGKWAGEKARAVATAAAVKAREVKERGGAQGSNRAAQAGPELTISPAVPEHNDGVDAFACVPESVSVVAAELEVPTTPETTHAPEPASKVAIPRPSPGRRIQVVVGVGIAATVALAAAGAWWMHQRAGQNKPVVPPVPVPAQQAAATAAHKAMPAISAEPAPSEAASQQVETSEAPVPPVEAAPQLPPPPSAAPATKKAPVAPTTKPTIRSVPVGRKTNTDTNPDWQDQAQAEMDAWAKQSGL